MRQQIEEKAETKKAKKTAAPKTQLNPGKLPKKALVLEDDQTQWILWENVLRSVNPDIEIDWETSESGAEKLIKQAYLAGHPYDLVISDVFLDGPETGIDLWNRYGEAATNFIFVSGISFPKFESMMSLKYGCPVYIQKPLLASDCKKIVSSISE